MKLVFGLLGAILVIAFLGAIVVKVPEVAMIVVIAIGVVMMIADLWMARNEADT